MSVFRTPDDRFDDLPGYPFDPKYHTVEGPGGESLRTHYVDTGDPADAPVDASNEAPVVYLHGEPTWSYLYRHMIPPVAERHRVVAPDFVGFGRSDKLTDRDAYTIDLHIQQLHSLFEALDLAGITLVVQDWGGMVGLAYAAHYPERIARLVVMNTFLPVGEEDEKSAAFLAWRRFVEQADDLPIGTIVRRGLAHDDALSDAEEAAYDAPFPTPESKAGAVAWPLMVPMDPADPVARVMKRTRERLSRWPKPAFVLFAPEDPVLGQAHGFFRSLFPTASDEPEIFVEGASHFLQEEKGEEIAQHILDFIERTQ